MSNIETLRARVKALGFELLEDDGPHDTRYYIRDPKRGTLVHAANALNADGVEHWLAHDAETDDEPAANVNGATLNTPHDDMLLGVERAQALAAAIQHQSEDGDDALAPLWTVLDRELQDLDKILMANMHWSGRKPKGPTVDGDYKTKFSQAVNALLPKTHLDRARDAAQMATYEIRDLVGAALTINESLNEDGQVEEVLKAALEKLAALANALDSVNFGKGVAA
jgi:hypothetical protein